MEHSSALTLTVGLNRPVQSGRLASRVTEIQRAPRLLLVGSHLSSSLGVRSVGEDLAAHLARAGWRVLVTSRKRSRYLRVLDILTTVWRERRRFDVAHVDVFSGAAFRWAEAVCRMLRAVHKPYVLTLRGGNLPAFASRAPERFRRLLQGATAVTAPSRYLEDAVRVIRADLRLLPNALQLDSYPFRLREHPRPRLVWLRAFHAIYNPEMAALVIARLATEAPHISLAMVGPDKDGSLARTRRTARRLGVADRVTFVGAVPKPDVTRYLAAGDIFLNTTNVDNTPVSVLEALATGLCVVSTNVGGIPYLLEHERDALLVPARDDEAMAAAVRRLLAEPELAARLSRNARAKAERFDWRNILPQWDVLLRDAARSHVGQLNA